MSSSIRILCLTLIAALIVSAFTGCNTSEADTSLNTITVEVASVLPEDLFTTVSLIDATTVIGAKASAEVGQEITLTGVIGGHSNPFTDERAMFVMADESLVFCGEECPVPWDACCVPSEQKAALVTTVQVLDEEGLLLRTGLEGQNGLAPNTPVAVRGTVAQSDGSILVINANQIDVTAPEVL